ncbi:MAG: TIGR00725 family protein [Nitrospirota bacterium]|nr:TIGR00725 family protein [Nitrospirota bacterium]
MRPPVIGVMGPGQGADAATLENAGQLGRLIAEAGWVLLTGGQAVGVMDAASRAARDAGGLVIGVLPQDHAQNASDGVTVAIVTGMGSARNNINVLSSDVVIACGMGPGTASEVALAIKAGKPVILLGCGAGAEGLFNKMSVDKVEATETPDKALEIAGELL